MLANHVGRWRDDRSLLVKSRIAAVGCLVIGVQVSFLALVVCADVRIAEAEYEGRSQFCITTESATYFYDRSGGGFSRLLDRDGRDWIAFHKDPLQEFPASAAAGYRGLPNLVFGNETPDGGAGHPGFDKCESEIDGEDAIITRSRSGDWEWRWEFTDQDATLTILRADPEVPYWFLYEGPIAGRWSPATHFFGTDRGGPRTERPDNSGQLFENWRWVYLGDRGAARVLLLMQAQPDELADTLWYLGSQSSRLASEDGMVVFGFGRGRGTQPLLRGAGQRFRIGFVEPVSIEEPQALQNAATEVALRWIVNFEEGQR